MNSLTSRPSYSQECGYHCTLVRRLRGTQIVMSAVKNTYIHTYIYIFQGTNTNQDIPFIQKAVTVLTSLRKINLSTYGVWWKLSITKISQICPRMGCDKGFGLQKYHKFVPVWGMMKALDYKNIEHITFRPSPTNSQILASFFNSHACIWPLPFIALRHMQ